MAAPVDGVQARRRVRRIAIDVAVGVPPQPETPALSVGCAHAFFARSLLGTISVRNCSKE
jgi:hypothetical protein